MKKLYLALILVICVMTGVYGQTGPKDLILVLDTSASMSSSYRETSVYLPGAFIQEHLRIGDTFHLIPFSGRVRLDIARRVEGRGELETIIGRMLLQYPLDSYSDISGALTFAENYLSSLPARPKKIVLVSDGVTFLPPGSSSRQLDSAGLDNLVNETKTRLARQNVTLEYVKVTPGVALPSAPRQQQTVTQQTTTQTTSPAAPGTGTSTQTGSTPQGSGATSTQTGSTQIPSTGTSSPTQQGGTSSAQTGTSTTPGTTSSTGAATSPGTSTTGTSTYTGTQNTGTSTPATSAGTGVQTGTTPGTQTGTTTTGASTPGTTSTQTGIPGTTTGTQGGATGTESMTDGGYPAGTAAEGTEFTDDPFQGTGTSQSQSGGANYVGDTDGKKSGISPLAMFIGLAIVGLAALVLIILLISKEMHRSPNKAMSRAASPAGSGRTAARGEPDSKAPPYKDHSKELAGFAATQGKRRETPYSDHKSTETTTLDYSGGPVTLNLFVEDQNTHIGKRNIHSVKPGYSFTVGGGKSDFLIFLVPMPANIGELRVNDNRCTFTPKKPQYFPDITQPVQDCIGKTIRVVSDKNYEIRFRFERYEDPLHALNRLLNSVKVAEAPPAERYSS